mgnify:CR=1 FL=1
MELRQLVRDLYGIDRPQGCTEEEIAAVRKIFGVLPAVVEDFWRTFGRTKELNQCQDDWMFPEQYAKWKWLAEGDALILLNENQGVCRAGIRREDLSRPDPPVYTQMEDDDPWLLSAPAVSEFLEAALLYESVWRLKYSPAEFYWLTDEELAAVQPKLIKHPAVLRNWIEMEITCYSSRPDNLLAVMDVGDQYQTIYGGATEESCAALLEVMEGLGEPV